MTSLLLRLRIYFRKRRLAQIVVRQGGFPLDTIPAERWLSLLERSVYGDNLAYPPVEQ